HWGLWAVVDCLGIGRGGEADPRNRRDRRNDGRHADRHLHHPGELLCCGEALGRRGETHAGSRAGSARAGHGRLIHFPYITCHFSFVIAQGARRLQGQLKNGKRQMEDAKDKYAMKKRLMIGSLIISLLAGCAVGPKYRRPIVEPPSAFRGSADPATTPDPNSLADLKWYEVFKDEQLQELVRTALSNNYDLRLAVARVSAARANLGITRSDQFPNVTAGIDMTTL